MYHSMMFVFVFVFICSLTFVSGGPPIPATYDGYTLGTENAPIHLEMFFDLMCPNCKSAYPEVEQAFYHIHNTTGKIKMTLHTFPLPYHHNSFTVAQAAHALGFENPKYVWDWMKVVFKNQDSLGNGPTDNMTAKQVRKLLSDLAAKNGLPGDVVAKGLEDTNADSDTRVSWKYGCYRGVFGTPTFLINGVPVPEESAAWNSKDWIKFLHSVLNNKRQPIPIEYQMIS